MAKLERKLGALAAGWISARDSGERRKIKRVINRSNHEVRAQRGRYGENTARIRRAVAKRIFYALLAQ